MATTRSSGVSRLAGRPPWAARSSTVGLPSSFPGELDNLRLAVADDGAYSPPVGIPQECCPPLAAR